MGRGSKGRWIVFAVVQLVLAVVWWYVALWLTIGALGIDDFSGGAQLGVFGVLVAVSVGLHLAVLHGGRGKH